MCIALQNFTGGEVAPTLSARYDLSRYRNSVGCMENMLPDLRGMYAEGAGFDSLGVGDVHGDAGREISGAGGAVYRINWSTPTGAYRAGAYTYFDVAMPGTPINMMTSDFKVSRVMPVAAKFQTRAWGSLACVYLGLPVS